MFTDFRERGRETDRQTDRQTDFAMRKKPQLVSSHIHVYLGFSLQPSMCPDQEPNTQPVGVQDSLPTN